MQEQTLAEYLEAILSDTSKAAASVTFPVENVQWMAKLAKRRETEAVLREQCEAMAKHYETTIEERERSIHSLNERLEDLQRVALKIEAERNALLEVVKIALGKAAA